MALHCSECGFVNPEGANYCQKCGAFLARPEGEDASTMAYKVGETGEYEPVDYVEGIENPSEFPNLIRWLVGHGYEDEQIAKVIGGNALRALREAWV